MMITAIQGMVPPCIIVANSKQLSYIVVLSCFRWTTMTYIVDPVGAGNRKGVRAIVACMGMSCMQTSGLLYAWCILYVCVLQMSYFSLGLFSQNINFNHVSYKAEQTPSNNLGIVRRCPHMQDDSTSAVTTCSLIIQETLTYVGNNCDYIVPLSSYYYRYVNAYGADFSYPLCVCVVNVMSQLNFV